MKIGYFANQYPKVSHSFIRREIQALERQGVEVCRYALKSDLAELVDDGDIGEYYKTRFILDTSSLYILWITFFWFCNAPLRWLSALKLTLATGWHSDRGLFRHIFYFLEAGVLAKWSRQDNIEHIHAHFGTNSTTVVMLAEKMSGVSYSFTVHGPEEFDKPEFLSLGRKIERSSFVVGISSYGKSQLFRQISGKYWPKVNIIHCGLDAEFYDGDVVPALNDNKFVCVGRLCEQKGQILLVEAANILNAEGVDFHLTLAGDGPMRADVEQLIKKYNLTTKVSITGWISSQRVREEIIASRALVLPSFAEGLPVVIMEAMALSRPVISTYVAGIPELVIPDENGWLVPAGDISRLVDAMRATLDMPIEEINKMGMKAHNRVIKRHNIDTEAAKLIALFENAIAGGLK